MSQRTVYTDLPDPSERIMTPAEVAAVFRVDAKTVTRWAKSGKLDSIRTAGGHRRYRKSAVLALLNDSLDYSPPVHM